MRQWVYPAIRELAQLALFFMAGAALLMGILRMR